MCGSLARPPAGLIKSGVQRDDQFVSCDVFERHGLPAIFLLYQNIQAVADITILRHTYFLH